MARTASVAELRRALSTEIVGMAGLSGKGLLSALARPLAWLPAHRFSRLAADFDRHVAESGLMAAVRWVLPYFVESARAVGTELIPREGPLIIASNHPGGADGLVVASAIPRDDLKIIATGRPFFRRLYASAAYLIYTPFEAHGRMTVIRESIRHLRAGGALLIFPRGQVEPDPELLPGAEESVQGWSPSLPLLMNGVPDARLLLTVVSGVLSPSCLRHPLTRLRKEVQPRQVWAEFVQISQQMLFRRTFGLTPTARFAQPLTVSELSGGLDARATLSAISERVKALLAEVTPD